jgi:hypothetical protein
MAEPGDAIKLRRDVGVRSGGIQYCVHASIMIRPLISYGA